MNRLIYIMKLRVGAVICASKGHDFDRHIMVGPRVYEADGTTSEWVNRMCSRCDKHERYKRGAL